MFPLWLPGEEPQFCARLGSDSCSPGRLKCQRQYPTPHPHTPHRADLRPGLQDAKINPFLYLSASSATLLPTGSSLEPLMVFVRLSLKRIKIEQKWKTPVNKWGTRICCVYGGLTWNYSRPTFGALRLKGQYGRLWPKLVLEQQLKVSLRLYPEYGLPVRVPDLARSCLHQIATMAQSWNFCPQRLSNIPEQQALTMRC